MKSVHREASWPRGVKTQPGSQGVPIEGNQHTVSEYEQEQRQRDWGRAAWPRTGELSSVKRRGVT